MKITVDDRDVFHLTGPTHLSDSPQWSDANYKRAVMACLVQAVYALEKDRSLEKLSLNPLAPDWFIPFKYRPIKLLREENSEQIVGAVFKWSRRLSLRRPAGAPKVVVAFRGTMPQGDTWKSDLTADFSLMKQQLHNTPRVEKARAEVKQTINDYGVEKVCITGHSLGAAVCLLAGRDLAQEGCFVDAHLFNPPYPSLAPENLSLQVLRMVAVAGLATVLQDERIQKQAYDVFLSLKDWYPHLYVNVHDPICSSYVGYFSSRQYMLENGRTSLVQLASSNSLQALIRSFFGEARPYHLIPSAHVHIVDDNSSKRFTRAHGMRQWWSQEYEIHSRKESFDVKEYAERVNAEQPR